MNPMRETLASFGRQPMRCYEWFSLVLVAIAATFGAPASTIAQPRFESAAPTSGTAVSRAANESVDRAAYQRISYSNAGKRGAALVVMPGEIRITDAALTERILPSSVADWAELELAQANFKVLERSALGGVLMEVDTATRLGDRAAMESLVRSGQLKGTRWLAKFDLLKAEPIATASRGVDGQPVADVVGILGQWSNSLRGQRAAQVGQVAAGSVQAERSAQVWLVGMRYRVIDAESGEQAGQGYVEERMESGAQGATVMGVSGSSQGGVGFDAMVQRLVQRAVWEIDARFK
jgi:hypothetical protein